MEFELLKPDCCTIRKYLTTECHNWPTRIEYSPESRKYELFHFRTSIYFFKVWGFSIHVKLSFFFFLIYDETIYHAFIILVLYMCCLVIFKGLVHPKMKIILCFTHPWGILSVCDFLLSDESNWSYIKNCPGPSKPYNGTKRVLAGSCSKDLK